MSNFTYETATACPECGSLGLTWDIVISGSNYGQSRIRDAYSTDCCSKCNSYIREDLAEHVRLIQDAVVAMNSMLSTKERIEELNKITNEFNTLLRKRAKDKAPDSQASIAVFGKNHRRFALGNTIGAECAECNRLFEITDRDTEEHICPHCGAEQTIPKQNIIQL